MLQPHVPARQPSTQPGPPKPRPAGKLLRIDSWNLSSDSILFASRGDQSALDEVVIRCTPRLRAYVRAHMGAHLRVREDSEDLVQSVCREVLEDIRQGFEYRSRGAFLRWLFTCALNKIRARHRHQNRACRAADREVLFDTADAATLLSPSRHAIGREQLDRLHAAFDRLSADDKEVVLLTHFVGLDRTELGEELGISTDAARMRLGRAMTRLAELFEDNDPSATN
ncbi:MAG: sigma-70 family RNA polymerase sigma factor [bacterium]|nr:sigma-70 family RNA polymerase sigma factor [bacterium]